jgi:hypothetical protein
MEKQFPMVYVLEKVHQPEDYDDGSFSEIEGVFLSLDRAQFGTGQNRTMAWEKTDDGWTTDDNRDPYVTWFVSEHRLRAR